MNRFKELRKKHGYQTQEDLAKVLYVNQTAVSQWERGVTTPSPTILLRLSELYNVSTDYLLGNDNKEHEAAARIPVLGSIPAGIPLEAIEDIIDWEEIPASMTAGGKEYFALQVKGDSMYPEYLAGDVVIVRRTPDWQTGDVCVVYVNGYDATLKQLRLADDGSVTLQPRNPEYPPRTYTPEEVAELPISVAGVVVELRRKVGR